MRPRAIERLAVLADPADRIRVGSFAIGFVTTMLERRTQYHQSVLVERANPVFPGYREKLAHLTRHFIKRFGAASSNAAH